MKYIYMPNTYRKCTKLRIEGWIAHRTRYQINSLSVYSEFYIGGKISCISSFSISHYGITSHSMK